MPKFKPEYLNPAWKAWLIDLRPTRGFNALIFEHNRAVSSTLAGKPNKFLEQLGWALESNKLDVVRLLFAIYVEDTAEEGVLREWIVKKGYNTSCNPKLREILNI